MFGLKGNPLNLNTDEALISNPDDRLDWGMGKARIEGGKKDKLSEIGHGQVPFMGDQATAAAVSFARVTQRVTASFAQLRRVSLGPGQQAADAAARALLVALGLHAHVLAWNEELRGRVRADEPRKDGASGDLGFREDQVSEDISRPQRPNSLPNRGNRGGGPPSRPSPNGPAVRHRDASRGVAEVRAGETSANLRQGVVKDGTGWDRGSGTDPGDDAKSLPPRRIPRSYTHPPEVS